jgi:hypothetical protein
VAGVQLVDVWSHAAAPQQRLSAHAASAPPVRPQPRCRRSSHANGQRRLPLLPRCSAVAAGDVIYRHEAKRVLVVRFDLPRCGGAHVAKATWLGDADPRAEAIGALTCAEMRAYKLLQLEGQRHPSVGTLDAVVWAAAGPPAPPRGGGAQQEVRGQRQQKQQQREQQQDKRWQRGSPEPDLSPDQVALQLGSGALSPAAGAPRAQAGAAAAAPPTGSWVVLIQPYYGAATLDRYCCSRIAADPQRYEPGSLALERLLLPLLEGVARALSFVHSQVGGACLLSALARGSAPCSILGQGHALRLCATRGWSPNPLSAKLAP